MNADEQPRHQAATASDDIGSPVRRRGTTGQTEARLPLVRVAGLRQWHAPTDASWVDEVRRSLRT